MLGSMMKHDLTISDLIVHAGKYHGDTEVVARETSGEIRTSTWGEIAAMSLKLASALQKLGLERGDRIATLAWNNVRHLAGWFAISGSGMVCHTLNPRLFPDQLVYIINDATDRALFFDKTFLPLITGTRERLTSVEHYIYMGPVDDEVAAAVPGVLFFDELLETGEDGHQWPRFSEDLPSSLCYTSGTTGNPKGVLYSHRSTVLHTLAISLPDALNIAARETVLQVAPMFHANAWGMPYAAAMTGAKLVMPGPRMDGEALLELIDRERVTLALGVPTIWQMLLDAARKSGNRMDSVTRNVVAGTAATPHMIAEFRDVYGIETLHCWGMTESSPLGAVNQIKAKHVGLDPDEMLRLRTSQGRPAFGVDLRLVDDAGGVLPHDGTAQGALQCRGHWIVDTYFGKPSSALTGDGWFDTGDVATIDADGYLTIRDRSKDVIKSGGEWISSIELEAIAESHPGIAMAAAIAARHPKWDERPIIVAVRAEGANPSEAEIVALFADRVARWQIPDAVVFTDAMPISGTGKILKNKLRDQFADTLLDRIA
ncbi:MAG: long-chain-fatty-acid--CoA ligase [Paracoccus sp. (in: a-proteobacteria)]